MVEVVRPIGYIRTLHAPLSTEPHSMNHQVTALPAGVDSPAEVSGSWWAPRSSKPV
jgi:hypothetical protein